MSFSIFTSNGGHSHKAPGASSNNYYEHEQNRLNNKTFIKEMNAQGFAVTDTTSDANNKYKVLLEQVTKANNVCGGNKQLDISWHLNSGGGTGVEVYYYSESGKQIASDISSIISSKSGLKNRGAKQDKTLYFLNNTKAVAILIEVCFIDSKRDMNILETKRSEIMSAVADYLTNPFANTIKQNNENKAYTGISLVDYLKSIQVDSSFANRKRLAVSYQICSSPLLYLGTASQNIALLKAMRGK